jgi:hypothetical protein
MAINPYLMSMAREQFEKSAVVPPGGGDPSMGAAPPVDPSMGGAPPMDPAAMGAVPPAGPAAPVDPATAMAAMGGAPAPAAMPAAAPAPAAPAGGQKLKPEQMMQMIDMRLYNMQQQLTSIMNAMGVQVAPESLVLPPGTTGAPPAESALPGGPMAPPPPQDPAAAGAPAGAPPGAMPPDAMPPEAMPPEMAKGANWNAGQILDLHTKASAIKALRRSLESNAG